MKICNVLALKSPIFCSIQVVWIFLIQTLLRDFHGLQRSLQMRFPFFRSILKPNFLNDISCLPVLSDQQAAMERLISSLWWRLVVAEFQKMSLAIMLCLKYSMLSWLYGTITASMKVLAYRFPAASMAVFRKILTPALLKIIS